MDDYKAIVQKYERLVNRIPGMVYRVRIVPNPADEYGYAYVFEMASNGSQELLGLTPEEMVRDKWNTLQRMILPEDLPRVRKSMYDTIVAHVPHQSYYRLILPSGKVKWVWEQEVAVYDEDDRPQYLEGILMDVSEQKLLELELKKENRQLKVMTDNMLGLKHIVGQSQLMRELYGHIIKAAESDTSVIIYGETGTGKDLTAQAIHSISGRKGLYVPVNCGAIPEALLESEFFGHVKGAFTGAHQNKKGYLNAADGGTLFLDEIGELPAHLQVKLLRALETKTYTPVGGTVPETSSFHLIAATNQDLARLVEEKKMRSDFYYRIHVLPLYLPALRDRLGDLPLLIDAWKDRRGSGISIPLHVRLVMERYSWPGNVRELHNFLDRYAVLGDSALASLGDAGKAKKLLPVRNQGPTLAEAVLRLEESMILQALEQCRWNRGKAAAALGLNLRTFQRKLARLNLKEPA